MLPGGYKHVNVTTKVLMQIAHHFTFQNALPVRCKGEILRDTVLPRYTRNFLPHLYILGYGVM
jgi:hypothetical protein